MTEALFAAGALLLVLILLKVLIVVRKSFNQVGVLRRIDSPAEPLLPSDGVLPSSGTVLPESTSALPRVFYSDVDVVAPSESSVIVNVPLINLDTEFGLIRKTSARNLAKMFRKDFRASNSVEERTRNKQLLRDLEASFSD